MSFVVKDGVVLNKKGEIGVLYSKAYHYSWNITEDGKPVEQVMFYPPLVLYIANGGNPADLVDNQKYTLTEKGIDLTKTLYNETNKKSSWFEDIKYLAVKWIPQGKKIRITKQDGFEQIEIQDDIVWVDIPMINSKEK